VAFDIDIKTCTKEEWAGRITIECGALKQWQSLINFVTDVIVQANVDTSRVFMGDQYLANRI